MSAVFISYRRSDSAPYAGRIYDRLLRHYDPARIFMDIDSIDPGADFVDVLNESLQQCRVMLVVIGPDWLTISDENNQPRLESPDDFVRLEVKLGLEGDVLVIPVLVGGAVMPAENELPADLEALSRRQCVSIRDAGFHKDMNKVVDALTAILETREVPPATIIDGRWIAVGTTESGAEFMIRFEFAAFDTTLLGNVYYPTGKAGILNGKIDGQSFSFHTEHIPQFATDKATIYIKGRLQDRRLQLFMQSSDGLRELSAEKE